MAPEKWWLEDYFSGAMLNFRRVILIAPASLGRSSPDQVCSAAARAAAATDVAVPQHPPNGSMKES